MKSLRACLAAAVVALAGFAGAGSADAKPLVVLPHKPILHFCFPHFEKETKYLGIRKIGFRYYRVYAIYTIHVDRFCRKHVVHVTYRYVPLPWIYRHAPGV